MPQTSAQLLLAPFGWADRFEMLEPVGAGAMGRVWRAREIEKDRIVALKLLDPARSGDEQTLARLEIEGETLTKLREAGAHDHVVPILDFQITAEHACLIMEFIPGLDLNKWCATHRLGLAERVKIMAQVARAAGWFHSLGIVHRDLKPANILVNALTHQPVIVDFSIAKQDEGLTLTLTNEALGTAPYMAPEQIDRSRGEISPAADVYALGATIYELLTQVQPHPGDLTQIVRRHSEEIRPAPPSALNPAVPRDLECIILKALSHRPAERYADGTALADDLDRFLAGQPVRAQPISRLTQYARQARRKPALSSAIAACMVIGAVAFFSVRRAAHERRMHELEDQMKTVMQGRSWSPRTFRQAGSVIGELEQLDPVRGLALRQSFHEDVRSDIEATVQQSFLKAEDTAWLRDVASPWLSASGVPYAAPMQELITQRLSRWELLASVRAPFSDFGGLFPHKPMIIKDGLIHPDFDESYYRKVVGNSPTVIVKEDLRTPVEVAATFAADPASFRHVTFIFEFWKVRTDVVLYRVRHAPKSVLASMGDGASLPPDGFILYMVRGRTQVERALVIPDTQLLNRDFKMTVRIEGKHLEADVNGQWYTTVNDVLAFASSSTTNSLRISWQQGLGLREMALRTRTSEVRNPLEPGDMFLAQNQWTEAHREYEQLLGDPIFGIEADYKNAWSLYRMGEPAAAAAIWERLSQGPPGFWHDASTYRLWYDAALREGMTAARRYLQRLPDPETSQTVLKAVTANNEERGVIGNAYSPPAQALHVLHPNIEDVNDAIKALRIIGESDLRIAIKLSMGLHSNGLDNAALALLGKALDRAERFRHDTTDQFNARVALDEYTRITRSEIHPGLPLALKDWCRAFPKNTHYTAIASQEAARVEARAGRFDEALHHVQRIHQDKEVDPRLITYTWLLEGMIQRLRGDEAQACEAWQQGVASIAQVRSRSDLHLTDCIILHSLARTWSREAVIDVIVRLIGMSRSVADSETLQSAFIKSLLTTDDFPRALNSLLDQPRGQELARNSVLRSKTARETNRAWYALILERYFASTAFPPSISENDQAHVQSAVENLLAAFASDEGTLQDFFDYLQAWHSPQALPSLVSRSSRYPRPLVADLQWLLDRRYQHVGKEQTAQVLEK